MTNNEILGKAIQKAIDGGWKAPSLIVALYSNASTSSFKGQNVEMIRGFITGHEFAKALWGTKRDSMVYYEYRGDPHYDEDWLHHLQQMVIADDPIKYLGENI